MSNLDSQSQAPQDDSPDPPPLSCSPHLLRVASRNGQVDQVTSGHQAVAHFLSEVLCLEDVDLRCYLTSSTHRPWIGHGWNFERVEKDVCIFSKRKFHNSTVYSIAGIGLMEASCDAVWQLVKDPNQRHRYDRLLKDVRLLEQVNEYTQVLLARFELSTCFSAVRREVLYVSSEREVQQKRILASRSTWHPSAPPQDAGGARLDVACASFLVEPWVEEPRFTKMTYCLEVDLGGLPEWLVTHTLKRQALIIAYLRPTLSSLRDYKSTSISEKL